MGKKLCTSMLTKDIIPNQIRNNLDRDGEVNDNRAYAYLSISVLEAMPPSTILCMIRS